MWLHTKITGRWTGKVPGLTANLRIWVYFYVGTSSSCLAHDAFAQSNMDPSNMNSARNRKGGTGGM
ncbi:hypothetical protein M404DRAFT_997020 [Pisolithus tinctorius Marx 270]|uniref:Uncharacterized protein n=1 Tax=Pisolithus tinctorius Marx 270 TaxID=870435 RepID=A0A0C3PJN0_PISTI|nr:hypothetical protein M404DRAFT_997020 [Pisolithus tinctorius Marx 270]